MANVDSRASRSSFSLDETACVLFNPDGHAQGKKGRTKMANLADVDLDHGINPWENVPCILSPEEVAELLDVTVPEVRKLAKQGCFEIFVPESDPDEECILRADLKAWIEDEE